MVSRRNFLLGAAALGTLAWIEAPLFRSVAGRRRKCRYIVDTTSPYWGKRQDFSAFAIDKKVPLPSGYELRDFSCCSNMTSVFTLVDEDGGNPFRYQLPGTYHSAASSPKHGLVYLISNCPPARLAILDAETFDLVGQYAETSKGDTRNFTGHGVPIPGTDAVAFGMNHTTQIGKYGEISIRDAKTLKELAVFPSYGFDLHEIRLSRDGKYFVCGHYGSYLGSWAYKDLKTYSGYEYKKLAPPKIVYPGSVTMVEVSSGKRFRLFSDIEGGQQGHADSDEHYAIYLANHRAFMESRPGAETNPKFREGVKTEPDHGEFAFNQEGAGIAVAYDPDFHEVIVPYRNGSFTVIVSDTLSKERREIDLLPQLGWGRPKEDFVHGIAFHPDGKHYILSTSDGFVAVERGRHRVNPRMTFRLPLLIHTHLHIV